LIAVTLIAGTVKPRQLIALSHIRASEAAYRAEKPGCFVVGYRFHMIDFIMGEVLRFQMDS